MMQGVLDPSPTLQRPRPVRRAAGLVLAVLALLLLIMGVLGAFDLGHLVVLRRYFGNPFTTAFLVLLCATAALWLALPVRSEADDRGRARARVWLIVVTVVALLVGLFVHGRWYVYDPQVLAHAPSGDLVVAKVRVAPADESGAFHVHLFRGTGLLARDLGDFGAPCGDFQARFEASDRILVTSVYGDFHLRFDPATGAPLDTIGPRCAGT